MPKRLVLAAVLAVVTLIAAGGPAVAGAPGAITLTTPAVGAFLKGTVPIAWTQTYGDIVTSASVVTVELKNGGAGYTTLGVVPITAGSVSWNTTSYADSASWQIRLTATSPAGSKSDTKNPFTIDNTAPILNVTSPAACTGPSWCNAPSATVTVIASDATSGLASNPSGSYEFLSEGIRPLNFTATDRAGNSTSRSLSIQLDRVAPTLTTAVEAADCGGSSWCNDASATITVAASDATSGLVQNPSGVTQVQDEGTTQRSYIASDRAGNLSSALVQVNLDRGAPDLTLTAVPGACAGSGWCNSEQVDVTIEASDATSGLSVDPSGVESITAEGSSTVDATAIDNAGNQTSASLAINIDRTAPDLSVAVDAPCADGAWCSVNEATVNVAASDALSGLAQDPSGVYGVTDEGETALDYSAIDNAGNASSESATVRIDRTAPEITYEVSPAACADGAWCNADEVTVTASATDNLSGLTTEPVAVSSFDDEGTATLTLEAVDGAGNSTSIDVAINIDRTAPDLSAVVTPAGCGAGSWCSDEEASIAVSASDDASGLASSDAGDYVVTAEGETIETYTATDAAGNEASIDVTVRLDRTGPVTTINPTGLAKIRALDGEINGAAADVHSGVARVIVQFQPLAGAPTSIDGTCTGCGTTAATWSVATDGLLPGVYTVTAASLDVAGNAGNVSAPMTVIIV